MLYANRLESLLFSSPVAEGFLNKIVRALPEEVFCAVPSIAYPEASIIFRFGSSFFKAWQVAVPSISGMIKSRDYGIDFLPVFFIGCHRFGTITACRHGAAHFLQHL